MADSPIFIIGAARSGTKFLRDCLRADTRIAAVPYDVNYIWRYGQPNEQDDVLSKDSLNAKQVQFIRSAIQKQANWRDGKILLEKTVSNSLRVPFVEAIFPGARYVHLIRDGRDVATSAMKEWAAPPDYGRLVEKLKRVPLASLPYLLWYLRNSVFGASKKSESHVKIWGPRYPGIQEDANAHSLATVCAMQWQKSVEYTATDLANLPAERVFAIRYEDLVSDKDAITKLAAGLHLDSGAVSQKWQETVSPGRARTLTDAQKTLRQDIETILAKTLMAHGYPTGV